MSTAFIIKNNTLIASTDTDLKNGELVYYAYLSSKEHINKNRDLQLVNAKIGKISRAKKWIKKYSNENIDNAIHINENSNGVAEFII